MKAEKIQLENDEQILLQVRKHWFVLATRVLSILVLAILPLIFPVALGSFVALFIEIDTSLLVALYTSWLIVMWMMLFGVWTNYYLNIWIVTNKRLIAVTQHGFFFRTVASFRLERMQDIIVSVNGILATLLDFGTLEIQTAGEEKNFKVSGIPSPADIKATILQSADTLIARTERPAQSEV